MGNPNVPARGWEFPIEKIEEYAPEIIKCKNDIIYFAENYFYILNLDAGKQTIKLYPAQKRVLKKMMKNRMLVLCASRQVGKSSLMTIFILWLALFNDDQRILLVANKEATAVEIFGRVRMAYEMIPNWLKSPVVEYAKTSMEMENNSKISISTTTGTAARGQSVSCVNATTEINIVYGGLPFQTTISKLYEFTKDIFSIRQDEENKYHIFVS